MSKFIPLGPNRVINRDCIASAEIQYEQYANCTVTHLVIRLNDGTTLRFEHGPSIDVHKIMREIIVD